MQIQHDSEAREFSLPVEDGKAYIQYAQPDDQTLDLQHTIVPPEGQGRGVGSALVEHVLQYAREQGKRVVPSCPFVGTWLERHPEYQDLVR